MASLNEELKHILKVDPAARTRLEVALTYPGFHAMLAHRAAHWLWNRDLALVARFIAAIARFFTGIEIHPAATIGEFCFIDHGHGVVIGETAVIGNRVTLYQGVSLGGVSTQKVKRHPTLGDDVTIGSGAKLLGPITVGNGARVGSNAVLLIDAPAGATMVGIPARERPPKDVRVNAAPVTLHTRLAELEARLAELEAAAARPRAPSSHTAKFDA